MARHLGQTKKKKKSSGMKNVRELPKLIEWKRPAKRVFRYTRVFSKSEAAPVIAAAILMAAAWLAPLSPLLKLISFAAAAVVAGFSPLRRVVVAILHRRWPDEDDFVLIAALFVFLAGVPAAGALLVVLARVSELMESYILARSARGIESLSDVLPEKAHVEEEFGLVEVFPEEIREGDICVVMPGETIPADGCVLDGKSRVDFSAFGAGETPADVNPGDEILSGGMNLDDILKLRAIHSFEESALTRHIQCLENAEEEKTSSEERIEFYSSLFSLAVFVLAMLIGVIAPLFHGDWKKGLSLAAALLVLGSPSSVVLTAPVIFLGGLFTSSRKGVRFRGKETVEQLFRAKTLVFGKTGTITDGRYTVVEVVSCKGSEEELLRIAAAAESVSRHPIAAVIKQAAGCAEDQLPPVLEMEEIPGKGVSAFIGGKHVYAGNASFMEEHGVAFQMPSRAGAAIHVAVDGVYWGHILINDHVREGAFDAIEELRSQGIRSIVLLTGDVRSSTSKIARSLNFDMVKTDLTPEEKLSAISFLRKSLGKGDTLVYVGDGFHDAEMFAEADVGIALNAMGDDQTEAYADVVLMDEDILRVPAVMRIARSVWKLLTANVVFFSAVKLLLLLLALTGLVSVIPAALLNTVCVFALCLNALHSFSIR